MDVLEDAVRVVGRIEPEVLLHLLSFQTPGRSRSSKRPAMISCSSSYRRMMCMPYVTSSASTRMKPGSTRFT